MLTHALLASCDIRRHEPGVGGKKLNHPAFIAAVQRAWAPTGVSKRKRVSDSESESEGAGEGTEEEGAAAAPRRRQQQQQQQQQGAARPNVQTNFDITVQKLAWSAMKVSRAQ